MKTSKILRYVHFHCKICAQNFGDPEILRLPINFEAWVQSVREHVLLNHRVELEDKGKSLVNDWLEPLYS